MDPSQPPPTPSSKKPPPIPVTYKRRTESNAEGMTVPEMANNIRNSKPAAFVRSISVSSSEPNAKSPTKRMFESAVSSSTPSSTQDSQPGTPSSDGSSDGESSYTSSSVSYSHQRTISMSSSVSRPHQRTTSMSNRPPPPPYRKPSGETDSRPPPPPFRKPSSDNEGQRSVTPGHSRQLTRTNSRDLPPLSPSHPGRPPSIDANQNQSSAFSATKTGQLSRSISVGRAPPPMPTSTPDHTRQFSRTPPPPPPPSANFAPRMSALTEEPSAEEPMDEPGRPTSPGVSHRSAQKFVSVMATALPGAKELASIARKPSQSQSSFIENTETKRGEEDSQTFKPSEIKRKIDKHHLGDMTSDRVFGLLSEHLDQHQPGAEKAWGVHNCVENCDQDKSEVRLVILNRKSNPKPVDAPLVDKITGKGGIDMRKFSAEQETELVDAIKVIENDPKVAPPLHNLNMIPNPEGPIFYSYKGEFRPSSKDKPGNPSEIISLFKVAEEDCFGIFCEKSKKEGEIHKLVFRKENQIVVCALKYDPLEKILPFIPDTLFIYDKPKGLSKEWTKEIREYKEVPNFDSIWSFIIHFGLQDNLRNNILHNVLFISDDQIKPTSVKRVTDALNNSAVGSFLIYKHASRTKTERRYYIVVNTGKNKYDEYQFVRQMGVIGFTEVKTGKTFSCLSTFIATKRDVLKFALSATL